MKDYGFLLPAGGGSCERLDCSQGSEEWTSDINESGQVVDSYDDPNTGTERGFEWASGGPCETIPLCSGAVSMNLGAITNSGVVVGEFEDGAGDRHVFRIDDWSTDPNCVIIPIPVPPGTTISVGGTNDDLAIVGTFIDPNNPDEELGTPFLYENGTVITDPINPCQADDPNCLAKASDINNNGVIVGSYALEGFDPNNGVRIGFIATPSTTVPAVGHVGLVALAVLALLVPAFLSRVRIARSPSRYGIGVTNSGR